MLKLIADSEHYTEILANTKKVKHSLWIATADIKDLHVKTSGIVVPYLAVLSDLVRRGVSIRLLYAKKPGENFQKDFARYPNLKEGIESIICPRIHFKIIVFDMKCVYLGSANLTGAGMGMKSPNHRNFELGIWTDQEDIVENSMEQIDLLWRGSRCKSCKRKRFCPQPIK